jgi:hypothetical protein
VGSGIAAVSVAYELARRAHRMGARKGPQRLRRHSAGNLDEELAADEQLSVLHRAASTSVRSADQRRNCEKEFDKEDRQETRLKVSPRMTSCRSRQSHRVFAEVTSSPGARWQQ